MEFDDRTVIVTGGTGALGTAVVDSLLAAGARCRVLCRTAREVDGFPRKDRVTLVGGCDLTDEATVARLYEDVTDLWASIHIAGGFAIGKLLKSNKAELMDMLNINFVTCYLCCRSAVRSFGSAGGRIVNIAARPALEPRLGAGMVAYTASKAAVAALTQALAAEVAAQRILVNAVAPSIIDTSANRAAMSDASYVDWPTPAEIAATITFLASPANQITSGAIVPVYGRT
jgi:NAD(P)-dependent dehydrogenase (short-subunit alcohol dehydrogenase family)